MDSNIQFKDYNPGDPTLISNIVSQLKSQGLFDQFRKECIADVDTKPAYQNLRHRVDAFLTSYLSKLTWSPNLNKNQLRESIRKYVNESPFLEQGVERVVEQVVNPKIHPVLVPKVEHVVHDMVGSTKKINEYKPVVNIKYCNDAIPDNNNFSENKNKCSSMNYDHADNDDDEVSPPFEPHKQSSDTHIRFSDSDSNEYVEKKRIKIDNERNNATSPNNGNNSEETTATHLSEEDGKIKFARESDKPYKSKSKSTDSAKTSKEDKHQRDSDKGAASGAGKHHTSRSASKYSSGKDKEKKVKDNREKEKRDDSKDKSADKRESESKKSIKDEGKRKNKDAENDKENPSSSSEQKHSSSSRRHKSDHHRDDKHKSSRRDKRKSSNDNKLAAAAESEAGSSRQSEKNEEKPKCSSENNEMETGNGDEKEKAESLTRKEEPLGTVKHKNEPSSFDHHHHHHHHHHKKKKKKHKKDDKKDNCKSEKNSRRSSDRDSSSGPPSSSGNVAEKKDKDVIGGNTSSSVTAKKERRRSSSDKHKSNHGDSNVTEDGFRSSIYGIDSNGEYRLLRKPKIVNNSSELWKVIQLRKQYAELERRRSIASESGDSEINNSSEGKMTNNQFTSEFDEAERKRSTFNESSDNEVNNNSLLAKFQQSRKKYAELTEPKRFVASESSDNEINGSLRPKVVIQFRKKRFKLKRKTNESNNCKINNRFIVRAKNECGESNLRCSVVSSNGVSIENKNSVRFTNEYDKLQRNRFTFDDSEVNNNSELENLVHCEQEYVVDRQNFIPRRNSDGISDKVVRLPKNNNVEELGGKHLISNKNNAINGNLKFQFESTEQKYSTSNNINNNNNNNDDDDRFAVTDRDKLERYFTVSRFNNDEVNSNLECAKVSEKEKYQPYLNGHRNNETKDDFKFERIVQRTEICNKLIPEHVEVNNDSVTEAGREHIESKQRRPVAEKSKINGIKTNYELKKAIRLRQKHTKRGYSIAARSESNEYNSGLKFVELIQPNKQYPDLKLESSTISDKNNINNSSTPAEDMQLRKQHDGLEEECFVDGTTISNDLTVKEDIWWAKQCDEPDNKPFPDYNVNSDSIIEQDAGGLNDQVKQECFADSVRVNNYRYNSMLQGSQPEKQRHKLNEEKSFAGDDNVNSVLKENSKNLHDKLEQEYFNGSVLKRNVQFKERDDESENCFVGVANGSILKEDVSSEKQRDKLEYSIADESGGIGEMKFSKTEKTVIPLLKLTDIAELCRFDDNSLLCPKMNENDVVVQKEFVILAGSARDLLAMKLNTVNDRCHGKNKSFDDSGEKSDSRCAIVKCQDEVISDNYATDNNGNEINNLSKTSDLTEKSGEKTSICVSDRLNNYSKNREDAKCDLNNSITDGILNGVVNSCDVSELNLASAHRNNLNSNNLAEVKLDDRLINGANDSSSTNKILNANSDDQRVDEGTPAAQTRIYKKRKSIIMTRWAKEKSAKSSVTIKEEVAAAFDQSLITANSTQLEAAATQENVDNRKSWQERDKRISSTTAASVNGYDDSNSTRNSGNDGNGNSAIMNVLDRLSKSEILTDDKKQFVVYVSKCLRENTVKKYEQSVRFNGNSPSDNTPDDANVETSKAIKIVRKNPNHKLLLDRRSNARKRESEIFKNSPCIRGTMDNQKDGIESSSAADPDGAKPFFGFQFTLKNENISLFPEPQIQNATVDVECSGEKHEQFETTNDKDINELDESNTALRSIQNICKRKRAKDYYSHDELYKPRMTHSKSRRQRSMQL